MSTLAWVIIAVVAVFIIISIPIAIVLTKDGMARQRRLAQMKSFRTSVRPNKPEYDERDRRTVV